MTVHFKLTKENGLTRRINFTTPPSWTLLSARIANLYDIAIENIGVSYVDTDGDEVTLSSDDELKDLYTSVLGVANDGTIKFAVHDLSSLRTTDITSRSLPSAAPQRSHFRNTFGGHEVLPLVFDAEDEWQRLPGNLGSLFLSRDAPESPHAFVEVLESDVSKYEARDTSRSDLTFTPITSQNQNKDKGKERAATVEDDISSAGSVIGDEAPAKLPVHVFDMSSDDIFGFSPKSTVQLTRSGAATPAQAQSTPVITEQLLKADVSTTTQEPKAEALDDDPPLPSLDLPDPDRTPSLVHDVATLLTTISTVISTHPELSERFRNILINATNGTYWAAHRDAISRAAEDLHRTAVQETGRSLGELRRATEQEANARVTDAVGRIFRAVGEFAQDGQANAGSQAAVNAAQASPDVTMSDVPRTPSSTVQTPLRFTPLPPHPRFNHHSWFSRSPFSHPGGPSWGGLPYPPPPPPPPPPHPFPPPRGWPRPPPPRFWGRDSGHPESVVNNHGVRAAAEVVTTAAEARTRAPEQHAEITVVQPASTAELTPEELRAEVEKAKVEYKAQKERYRQAKATRKTADQTRPDKESTTESLSRQTSDNPAQVMPGDNGPDVTSAPTPGRQVPESTTATSDVHIVSNARGRYPQLEMFSVPKRGHPTGHMHRGHFHENRENRPLNRIMRKLSDMGFTEGAYPNLTSKVMDQLLSHPPVTKDAEDDIVTNLIEELIPSGGVHPGGPGIPGAWH